MAFLRLPSLAYRRMRIDVIEMYKYTHNIYQVAVNPYTLDDDTSRRNNCFKIIKERCTHPHGGQFFGNHVNNTRDALLSEIIQASSINSFKSRLDRQWKIHFIVTDVRTIQYKRNMKTTFTILEPTMEQ